MPHTRFVVPGLVQFHTAEAAQASVDALAASYWEGLNWVLGYYYGGMFSCVCWLGLNPPPSANGTMCVCVCVYVCVCVCVSHPAGPPSWKWFFPYRYAPLASDLVRLQQKTINFQLGEPFKPLEQLLGVLPPQSAKVSVGRLIVMI